MRVEMEMLHPVDEAAGGAGPRHTARMPASAARHRVLACWAVAALLVGASLVWPWYGWEGLRTWAPLFALVGLIACSLAVVRPWRCFVLAAALFGIAATALFLA